MVDIKALLLLTTSIILTALVVAAGFNAVTVSKAAQPRVVTLGSHVVIIIPLKASSGLRITRIIVNGVTLGATNIVLPSGTSYLLIESLDSVKVFKSLDALYNYINANEVFIPGRPLFIEKSYDVKIVLSNGETLEFILKP